LKKGENIGGIMPIVTIEASKLKGIDLKRNLVKEVTDALEKAYKLPRDKYIVVIKENELENIAVGGELIVDNIKKT
jgi:4-oxalocrotonate tautomerase